MQGKKLERSGYSLALQEPWATWLVVQEAETLWTAAKLHVCELGQVASFQFRNGIRPLAKSCAAELREAPKFAETD